MIEYLCSAACSSKTERALPLAHGHTRASAQATWGQQESYTDRQTDISIIISQILYL